MLLLSVRGREKVLQEKSVPTKNKKKGKGRRKKKKRNKEQGRMKRKRKFITDYTTFAPL